MQTQDPKDELLRLYEALPEEARELVLAFVRRLAHELEAEEEEEYDEDLENPEAPKFEKEELVALIRERRKLAKENPDLVMSAEECKMKIFKKFNWDEGI